MSNPAEVSDLGGSYAVRWPEKNIRILIEYLHKQTQGLIGEITIRDGEVTLCESLRINLNAEPKTKSIAKKVHEYDDRLSLPDWARLIETTCVLVLRRYRCGEPSYYIDRHSNVEQLTFAINPLVPRKKPIILFADGGKGKSTFGLMLCMLVSAGCSVAGFSALKGRALYLDWEDDVDVHTRRLHAIQAGHPELEHAGVEYQRCTEAIWKQTYRLMKLIADKGITFVVLDSLMAAAEGDASAEATGKLFATLRQFNCESLCIGHVPKTVGEGERVTVYGSVFNQNYARGVWQLKTEQETGEKTAIMGLFQEKTNLTRKHPPIGLKVTHAEDGTLVRYDPYDLSQTVEIEKALPLPNRIRNLLDSDGVPRTSKYIADALDVKLAVVQATLSRHKGMKWSLIGDNREALWTTITNP